MMMFAQVTQRLFPLCGQSTRMVMMLSSRVIRPAFVQSSSSSSSTILSEGTRMRDNFHHGRTILVPSVLFSTWRYYSPIYYFTTTLTPFGPLSRAPRFVTLVGDSNNNLPQQQTRGFATKKVSDWSYHMMC